MSNRPYLLGLTGSVGMGKSTTAQLFADLGVPVWDADAVVHRIYAPGGAGVAPIGRLVPMAVTEEIVDRAFLRDAIKAEPDLLAQVEAAIHPLVAADRADFIAGLGSATAVAVFDVPLLFETGIEDEFDGVLVVTAPAEVQRARVLARPGMDAASLALVLSRQMPDADKRAGADFIIDTSSGIEDVRHQVQSLIQKLTVGPKHA